MKLIKNRWGIGIWLERWHWCLGYQNLLGAHTFYLPFVTVILYTPEEAEDE